MKGLLSRIQGATRATKHDHRAFLLEMLNKNSIGAEIGVHQGDFSKQILDTIEPAKLHLIDPWKHMDADVYKEAWYGGQVANGQRDMDLRHQGVIERFRPEIGSGQVEVHRAFSNEASAVFADHYFDWIYIDGNHLYEFVKNDLESYWPKVKAGGFLAGDDYGDGGWWDGGVKKAVDEFTATHLVEIVAIRNRQFALRKQ
jgi:hypothetical protein